mmetsp:Transcript_63290/g.184987  ORF Transcript_63290/g.184987 Transcript_63290/m.184987 type:complete len:234 (+) Transcript_63290:1157-1858(+)
MTRTLPLGLPRPALVAPPHSYPGLSDCRLPRPWRLCVSPWRLCASLLRPEPLFSLLGESFVHSMLRRGLLKMSQPKLQGPRQRRLEDKRTILHREHASSALARPARGSPSRSRQQNKGRWPGTPRHWGQKMPRQSWGMALGLALLPALEASHGRRRSQRPPTPLLCVQPPCRRLHTCQRASPATVASAQLRGAKTGDAESARRRSAGTPGERHDGSEPALQSQPQCLALRTSP